MFLQKLFKKSENVVHTSLVSVESLAKHIPDIPVLPPAPPLSILKQGVTTMNVNFEVLAVQCGIKILMAQLPPEKLRKFAENTLEFAREEVLGTKSTVDDAIVLPIIDLVENAFGLKPQVTTPNIPTIPEIVGNENSVVSEIANTVSTAIDQAHEPEEAVPASA